ncbi:carboxylating nicotinate-nucleotide diphosphorylase, partial [Candidatus Aerophobetes bacterium]
QIVAKEEGLLAGVEVAKEVFRLTSSGRVKFTHSLEDGDLIGEDRPVLIMEGSVLAILRGERVALNFLSRLSGIATLTRKYVDLVKGLEVRIMDTRKTSPNLRALEKYAVKTGGGLNHRFGLDDGVLIKDNHIKICGGVGEAVRRTRQMLSPLLKIEVEVENLAQLEEAIDAGADIVMLDNMEKGKMQEAVRRIRSQERHILIEASGGISLENVRDTAETGVDFISVGGLTHSAMSLNFALEMM